MYCSDSGCGSLSGTLTLPSLSVHSSCKSINLLISLCIFSFINSLFLKNVKKIGKKEKCRYILLDVISTNTTKKNLNKTTNKKKRNINIRGLWLHIIGDILGSVVVIISSSTIKYSDSSFRFYTDPSVSLVTVTIICFVTFIEFVRTLIV